MSKLRSKSKEEDELTETTKIRRSTLERVRIVKPYIGQSIAKFVSDATDRATTVVVKKHGITLPPSLDINQSAA